MSGRVRCGARLGALARRGVGALVPASVTRGESAGYSSGAFGAFTAMWGHSISGNESMVSSSSLRAFPASFPAGTVFDWSITPDADYSGVNGFLHTSWGNYDNSPGVITPRQVNTLSAYSLDTGWVLSGSAATGVLAECYLSAAAAASGDYTKSHEVGFFVHCAPGYVSYIQSLPAVGTGSFTANGVTWNVVQGSSSNGGFPYFIAFRPGYVDFTGVLPFREYLVFLLTSGKITGNEWVNGVAIGVEPYSGTGEFTLNRLVPVFAGGASPVANLVTNGDFSAADAGWGGFWYSGKAPSNGKAVFTASPPYDGISQNVTVTTGKYYEVSFTVSGYSAGSVAPLLSGTSYVVGTERLSNGTFTERLLAAAGTTQFSIQPRDSGATLSIDNVSLIGPYTTATVGGA